MAATRTLVLALADGRTVDAVACLPAGPGTPEWAVAYAPGAGSNLHDGFGAYLCERLTAEGFAALRFQFPYQQARVRRPDPPPVLRATWRAAIDTARPLGRRLALSGRSMGGRIASLVAAEGAPADALVLFAYPLHPPGRPDQRRDAHLPRLTLPVLLCSGTRDAFGTPEELAEAARLMPRAALRLLEGADHAFDCPKASGRTRQDVWRAAADACIGWLRGLGHEHATV